MRVFSGVANLASDYGCSNPCSFRDMTFFLDFFQNFSKNLDITNSQNLKLPSL